MAAPAWSADLWSASRGSAKPALMAGRSVNSGAAPGCENRAVARGSASNGHGLPHKRGRQWPFAATTPPRVQRRFRRHARGPPGDSRSPVRPLRSRRSSERRGGIPPQSGSAKGISRAPSSRLGNSISQLRGAFSTNHRPKLGSRPRAGEPLIQRHDNMGPPHADLLRPHLAGSLQYLGEPRLRCGDGPHLYWCGEVARIAGFVAFGPTGRHRDQSRRWSRLESPPDG